MLILLDIDGVMVPGTSWRQPEFLSDGFPAFSFKAVKALERIINETGARIILTTSHKTKYDSSHWNEIFRNRDIHINHIDRLPSDSSKLSRKDEILNWYYSNNHSEAFVILDDDKYLNDLPEDIKHHLVLTSSSLGLTDELAEEAIAKLTHDALTH
ncbi:HAD domain-containing protein [Pedobacter agri]|uniref:HAD domain-containing protein n=1 Tax=Pedobacter agri TaxID=454586 RepID=UPI00292EF9C1|nr:HAD domain-containing protein [Pedobacter agri]